MRRRRNPNLIFMNDWPHEHPPPESEFEPVSAADVKSDLMELLDQIRPNQNREERAILADQIEAAARALSIAIRGQHEVYRAYDPLEGILWYAYSD
jgi:hypothetical protein